MSPHSISSTRSVVGPERSVPFTKISGGETERTGAHLLAAEDLKVKPGDVITYYARARDVGRGKRSTETTSDMFFLEVRPFNEEFVASQSQANARAGAEDQQLEALIQAQKDIISATWNIERRSAGGRSAADIKAIAQVAGGTQDAGGTGARAGSPYRETRSCRSRSFVRRRRPRVRVRSRPPWRR